jgi:hypothetical protein
MEDGRVAQSKLSRAGIVKHALQCIQIRFFQSIVEEDSSFVLTVRKPSLKAREEFLSVLQVCSSTCLHLPSSVLIQCNWITSLLNYLYFIFDIKLSVKGKLSSCNVPATTKHSLLFKSISRLIF